MSDEQTRLLQQILDVSKEQLAFVKQQREELMAMQRTALQGQKSSLRMSRFVIAFMLIAVALLIAVSVLSSRNEDVKQPTEQAGFMDEAEL